MFKRSVATLGLLITLSTAHALTLPSAFSLEVGQRVDLRTLTDSDATFTSSGPAVVSIENGRYAVVKHLTADGTPLTITATGGGSTVVARVSTHGIEYAVGQVKTFGGGNSVEGQILLVRARLADDVAPANLYMTQASASQDINRFNYVVVKDRELIAVGKMKLTVFSFPFNSIRTVRIRTANINGSILERTINLPALSGYSGPTSSFTAGVQATFQNGVFMATGPASAPRSYSLRLVPEVGGLENAANAVLPQMTLPLSATIQGVPGGLYKAYLRAFDSPVLDPKTVLPDRVNATQQFLLSTTIR